MKQIKHADIQTIAELELKFENLKNKLHPKTMLNNAFVNILSAMYRIDQERASQMWQYVVDQNSISAESDAARNIRLVYTKLIDSLSRSDAARFLSMQNDRVKIMFLYCYEGSDITLLGFITKAILDEGDYKRAYQTILYLCERQRILQESDMSLFSHVIGICLALEEYCDENDIKSQNRILEFYNYILECNGTEIDMIDNAVLARKSYLSQEPRANM